MKKILLPTIVLLTLLLTSCGAPKEFDYRNSYTSEVLDGIFKLRLGMSEGELREVVDTTLLKDYVSGYGIIYDKDLNRLMFTRVRKLELEQYIPAFGITLERIRLDFFDDKLYRIEIQEYNSYLGELLTQKYGEPKEKIEKGTNIVRKTYAERTSEYDTIKSEENYTNIYRQWRTNDRNITCKSESKSRYYRLELENKAVLLEIDQAESDWRRKNNEEVKERKEKTREQLLDEF